MPSASIQLQVSGTSLNPCSIRASSASFRVSNRRVVSAGAFVGGVLSTRSAWVIGGLSLWLGLEPGRKLRPSPRLAFLVHDIHEQSNNTYAKISRQAIDRRLIGSFARFARAVFGYRCMDHETKRAGSYSSRSHPPPGRSGAEGEKMTEQEELIQDIRERLGEMPEGALPFDLP